ncbi:MAG: glycosyltransferase [Candidatus Omnitrophica bacterium]|nr:glycosyltransferase [Candidatus Omnitrophota bacterium]
MESLKISIIIPAYNCEKGIGRTLEAALTAANNYRNAGNGRYVEIIVVDDGSTDNTKAEIAKYPTVKYYFQQNAGPAAARNLGALEGRGDILFFTDADCLPHGDWLELIMPHFEKPNVAVVAGSYGIANPENRLSRCIYREIIYRHMQLMPEFPSYFGSFNFAVRREVFQAVGGFNAAYRNASGEDNDLSYKVSSRGYRIYFAKDALVDHHHPELLREYLHQQYRHGYWRVQMYRDHPKMAKGDGYTFWKDIVEVGCVMLFYFSFVLIFLGFFNIGVWALILSICAVLGMNVYFGIKIAGGKRDGIFFADVMVLRAFSRTNGFLAGIEIFFQE